LDEMQSYTWLLAIGFTDPVLGSDSGQKYIVDYSAEEAYRKGLCHEMNKHFVPLVFKLVGCLVEERINVKILLPSTYENPY
jgi:hypothetical protein